MSGGMEKERGEWRAAPAAVDGEINQILNKENTNLKIKPQFLGIFTYYYTFIIIC